MRKLLLTALLLLLCCSSAFAEGGANGSMVLQGINEEFTIDVPDAFYIQRVEADLDRSGNQYTFENPDTGEKFIANMSLLPEADQRTVMRILQDKSSGGAVLEDVWMGDYSFLVSHVPDTNVMWGFLMREDAGFTYRFWYQMPEDGVQTEIPEAARAMLSSIRKVEKPSKGRAHIPEFHPEDYPKIQPIDPNDKENAEMQMLAYARALLSSPAMSIPFSENSGWVDWTPGDWYWANQWHWGGPVYTAHLSREGTDDPYWNTVLRKNEMELDVNLRPDGTLRSVYVPLDIQYEDHGEWLYTSYDFVPGDAFFPDAWWKELTDYLTAFAQAVDPDHARNFQTFIVRQEQQWNDVRILEIYCQNEDLQQDLPFFYVQIAPEIRIFGYGIGVG